MKKKIALLLSLLMLSQHIGVCVLAEGDTAQAAEETVAVNTADEGELEEEKIKQAIRDDIKEEVAVLTHIGVIELEEDYDPTEKVTRAEFANYTAIAMNVDNRMQISYFTDVPMNYWASDSINSLVELKVISKSANGMFNPDRVISYAEACKMMTVITGYKVYANYNGDMNQYISVANSAGFGIIPLDATEMTRADAIKLLYNAMRVDLVTVNASGKAVTSNSDKANNIFSKYHQIKFDDGRVESVPGKSLNDAVAQNGTAIIDGDTYYIDSAVSIDEYFARHINYVYKETTTDIDFTVIYAEPRHEDDVTEIKYDALRSYDDVSRKITYDAGDEKREKIKTEILDKNVDVIFNGRPYTKELKPKIEELISGERKGTVELISSQGNKTIDVISVTSYEIFNKDAYNPLTGIFYGTDGQHSIKTEDYKNFTAYDIHNNVVKLADLKSGPYMIEATEDKEKLVAIVCLDTVEGIIQSIDEGEFKIGDKIYKCDENFWNKNSSKFNVGVSYILYLDKYNEVVDMVVAGVGGMKNAYITGAKIVDEDSEVLKLKLYTADDDTLEWHEFAANLRIDGVTYKASNMKDVIAAFPGKSSISGNSVHIDRQVIRYSINTDGKINEIDTTNLTSSEDKNTTLRALTNGVQKQYYRSGTKTVGMTGYIDNTTKYIVLPVTDENGNVIVNGKTVEDTKYSYANKYAIADWEYLTYELYKYTADSVTTDLIAIYIEPKKANYDIFMYDKLTKEVDEDGLVVNKICGYSAGSQVKYTLDDMIDLASLSDIEQGDILRFETDPDAKRVYTVTKMYDVGDDAFCDYPGATGTWATDPDRYWYGTAYAEEVSNQWGNTKYQLMRGYATDIQNGIVAYSHTLDMAYNGKLSAIFKGTGLPITVYEPSREKNPIYSAQLTDILTYKVAGNSCDYMLVSSRDASYKQIFIIKK